MEPIPHTLVTTDLYEAGYYLSKGYTINKTELLKESKKVLVQFTFTGVGLRGERIRYASGEAEVNLSAFRRAYAHLNYILESAKKYARLEAKEKKALENQTNGGRP
jgi:hypothetical protein